MLVIPAEKSLNCLLTINLTKGYYIRCRSKATSSKGEEALRIHEFFKSELDGEGHAQTLGK